MVSRVLLITLLATLNFGLSRVSAAPRDFWTFPPITFREPQGRATECTARECGDKCSGVPSCGVAVHYFTVAASQSRERRFVGRGLPFRVYSLPRGERSSLLLLTESDIKEEDLQESRPIAPGWMGFPPAAVAPAGTKGTLPTEPEGESAAPLGELGVGDEALPSVQGEERPATALRQEASSILPGEPSLLAKITPETSPRRAASLRLTEEGRRLLGSGEYEKAIEQFEKTIAIDSTNPYSYYYLARAHHRLSHYRESLNFLDVAESLLSEESFWLAQVFALKGKNFQILGSFERADASYAHALELDPNNQDAFEAITRIGFKQAGPLK